VDFDGSAAITVTAAAGTLTGDTLNAEVVTSSLTTVGVLANGSIDTGFGTINNAAAITGTVLTATTNFTMGSTVVTDGVITDATGLSLAADVTVTGDLTINGTTTTVNTTNTVVTDNLLELNSGASSNANDSGIIIERGSTGDNAILMWDESATGFTVGTTTATAASTGDLADFAAAPFTAAAINGTVLTASSNFAGALTGEVTGNAATATKLATTRAIAVAGDVTGTANFDGSAAISITTTNADASVDFAHIQNVAANSILGRNANSSGVLSEVALATTQILIGDGTGFTAAALSGDATMTNAGVVTVADDAITLAKLNGGTAGNIIAYDASGDPVAVATGTDGQVLTSAGAGAPPAFEDAAAGGGTNPNLLHNGAMQVSERYPGVPYGLANTQASVTASVYVVDRWQFVVSALGTWTVSQSDDSPAGFGSSLKLDNTTADASPAAADYAYISQALEGQDVQILQKGLATAESVTISFKVKSAKTGVHIVEITDVDNTRHISASYSISVADTWESHEVTFAGDTTGAFDNDIAASLRLNFWVAAGSNFTSGTLATSWAAVTAANSAVGQVNVADNTANNFLLSGVKMEIGTSSTAYAHKSFAEELAICQRYFWRIINTDLVTTSDWAHIGIGHYYTSSQMDISGINPPTTMRVTSTLVVTSATDLYKIYRNGTYDAFDGFTIGGTTSNNAVSLGSTGTLSGTAGQSGGVIAQGNLASNIMLALDSQI
jgi:hypothetical protein